MTEVRILYADDREVTINVDMSPDDVMLLSPGEIDDLLDEHRPGSQ